MGKVSYVVGEGLDRVDAWRHRKELPGGEHDATLVRRADTDRLAPSERATREFDRDDVLLRCGRVSTIEGREYPHVLLAGDGDTLCVHYSAFFGEAWSERRRARSQYRGWFHRLRTFWPLVRHNFLFLCDTAGADQNGTYYKGVNGDFFVERAMERIQSEVASELNIAESNIVTIGSSMGANAAIRFALRGGYAGVVAVTPHIDLDISAVRQGRLRHVAAIVGREDVGAPELWPVTREIRTLVQETRPLPRLAIQSSVDDHGVHYEQVLPLVAAWKSRGGATLVDYNTTGGHSTVNATLEFFERSIDWCLAGRRS